MSAKRQNREAASAANVKTGREPLNAARIPLAMNIMVEPGSYLVERYSYEGPKGGRGRQWVVHRVEKDGSLTHLIVCDTRRKAAEYVARGKL